SWTGWYAGVNAGASFGNVKTNFNAPVTVALSFHGAGPDLFPFGSAGSDTVYPDGFIGGGQIGYNWQLSPIWVVGLEADIQGGLESSSGAATSNFSGFVTAVGCGGRCLSPTTVVGSTVLDYQTKIEWFGTVRGRLGYVWGDGNVMSY